MLKDEFSSEYFPKFVAFLRSIKLNDFNSSYKWICYMKYFGRFCSVQFSCSVVSNSVTPWTIGCQASLSLTISQNLLKLMSIESVIHPTISSSVVPFSSPLQYFPASGSFQMSQFLPSGGQTIGVSASASVLPVNIQD